MAADNENGIYRSFAGVYDLFMSDVPYGEWSRRIDHWIGQYGISRKKGNKNNGRNINAASMVTDADLNNDVDLSNDADLVVDLGCGTGTLTGLLADMGYECIGIDCSPEMLTVAREKETRASRPASTHDNVDARIPARPPILYLCQDMREMELYGTVGTIISVCDCLNYLLTADDIVTVFRQINNYLYPGGIFIFDFNTVYKYATVIGDATIAENREECSFIWENYYHEDGLNEYEVFFFVREKNDRYQKFQENHFQRGYDLAQMKELLQQGGLKFMAAFDGESGGAVNEYSERIYIIAGEAGKNKVTVSR